jgi:hypothetical protein
VSLRSDAGWRSWTNILSGWPKRNDQSDDKLQNVVTSLEGAKKVVGNDGIYE